MTDTAAVFDRLHAIFEGGGAQAYLGEPVTVGEHMLQCAALARAEGASDALVAAALLHDIGHLVGERGGYEVGDVVDRGHHDAGADFLSGDFAPEVVESVRLHVAAKRYLCATDRAYASGLSAASRHSLSLQGGPMSDAEIAAFERLPFSDAAVRVRRWDDAGKIPDMPIPSFSAYRPLLERVARGRAPSGEPQP